MGDAGTILVTSDGGSNWKIQTTNTTAQLLSVHFSDAMRGWVVGMEGTILGTSDGGSSWQPQVGGTRAWLASIRFIDAARGWAVGLEGTILTTSDGGLSWEKQTSGATAVFRFAHFLDAAHGWAVGVTGAILVTSDGGHNWRSQISGTTARLRSVHFVDTTRGWAVGDDGTILVTSDGGNSWQPQISGTTEWLTSVYFHDTARGVVVGVKGTILTTSDGGRSWQPQISGTDEVLNSVYFFNAALGWAVGRDGTILATRDGGRSWQPQNSGTTASIISVQFINATHGWAVGTEGTILTTADAGSNWQIQSSGTTAQLTSVQFIDSTHGWTVGDNGTILTTTNSGNSWQKQTSGTTDWLRSVRFIDAMKGWAVGREGTVLATTDGRLTWSDIARYQRFPAPWVFALLVPTLASAAWAVRRRREESQPQEPAGVAGIFVSDRPLNPGDKDHLGHGVVARGLANFITNENTSPGLTVAVTGAWGLGKSSVMRLLEHALQRAGFRTAWFNAWHHQQEGRQLASMLNAIRGQAIPPGYSVKGLRLRFKLLWQRGWWYRGMLMLLLLVMTVAVCGLSGTNQLQEDIWLNVKFHILERKPTVLTASSLDRIEKEAVTAPDAIKLMCANMLWQAEKQPDEGACIVALNRPPSSEKRVSIASAAQQKQPDKGACMVKRDDKSDPDKDPCEFENHAQLLTALEQLLEHRHLSTEERASITSAAQHLPPPPLLEGLLALAALTGAVLLLFVGKGFTVFGFDISALLGRFVPGQRPEAGKEAVGTLEHFRKEFELITEALEGRLVLFIDDLDRCDCAAVREVLDMVNYLVTTGQCFIVLGVAMEHIECCIESKSDKQPQDVYAREYLKKLINIEVPVPVAPLARSRRMLEQQATEQRTEPGFDWRRRFGRVMVITILAGVVWAGIEFNKLMHTPKVEFRTEPAAETVATPSSKTTTPVQTDGEKTLTDTRNNTVGVEVPPEVSLWPSWLVVILAAIFVVVVSVLSLLPRERVRQLFEKWFKRAKIAAGGAERTVDSHAFKKALTAWHDVIALGDSTPRGIKRFVNRVRLFAMRERAAYDDKTEAAQATSNMENTLSDPQTETPLDDATLVALAALHHINDDETFNPEKATKKGFNKRREGRGGDDENEATVRSAISEHQNAGLPWPPTPEQIERFKEIAQGFYIR